MASADQFSQLTRIIARPRGMKAFLTWQPFSITAFRMMQTLKKQGYTFGTIIDGGANIGQFARAATETFPEARVISIEPLPDVYEMLKKNLSDRPQVEAFQAALGREDGELEFHRNAYSLASSALPVHENQRETFPDAKPLDTIQVPEARLDTLLRGRTFEGPLLLKLDLQGFELHALQGGRELLKQTDYVLLEIAFKPMYEGEPLFDDVYGFMRNAGFRFERPVDVLQDKDGEIIQMDGLFSRTAAS